MKSSFLSYLALGLILLLAVYIVGDLFQSPDMRQWDFKSYYCAAKAAAAGANPYDGTEVLHYAGGLRGLLPYVYPPPTLAFFRPFTWLPFPAACEVWLVLKLLLLVGLILVWRGRIFPMEPAVPFYLLLLLAFGSAIYVDLDSGNVTLLEQFLLWLGIASLLRGRPRPLVFCASLLLAAFFKLTPLAFVLLLPALGVRRCWRYVGLSVAVFIGLAAVSYLADPLGWQHFFTNVMAIDEPGIHSNPSLLSLMKDVVQSIAAKWGGRAPDFIPGGLYLVSAALILGVSVWCWRSIRFRRGVDRDMVILCLFCVTFALIMPRFKTYAFVLLLPPAYYAISRNARMPAFAFMLVLLVLRGDASLPVNPFLKLFWQYYPLLLAFMVWGLLLRLARATAGDGGPVPSAGA